MPLPGEQLRQIKNMDKACSSLLRQYSTQTKREVFIGAYNVLCVEDKPPTFKVCRSFVLAGISQVFFVSHYQI